MRRRLRQYNLEGLTALARDMNAKVYDIRHDAFKLVESIIAKHTETQRSNWGRASSLFTSHSYVFGVDFDYRTNADVPLVSDRYR